MKGKMLMFNMTHFYSFVYDMTGVLCFRQENEAVKRIYKKHKIQKYFCLSEFDQYR